jgi:hypothetical protein
MFRDRPIAQRGAGGNLVSQDVVVPLVEQLSYRHFHVGSRQPVVELSLEFLQFADHLGPGLRRNGLANYSSVAIAPDRHDAEPVSIGRPLIN